MTIELLRIKMIYKVYDICEGIEDAREIEASSPEQAAEKYAEREDEDRELAAGFGEWTCTVQGHGDYIVRGYLHYNYDARSVDRRW